MTNSPLFTQLGKEFAVNAKLGGFSSSLHMQSASCMISEPEMLYRNDRRCNDAQGGLEMLH